MYGGLSRWLGFWPRVPLGAGPGPHPGGGREPPGSQRCPRPGRCVITAHVWKRCVRAARETGQGGGRRGSVCVAGKVRRTNGDAIFDTLERAAWLSGSYLKPAPAGALSSHVYKQVLKGRAAVHGPAGLLTLPALKHNPLHVGACRRGHYPRFRDPPVTVLWSPCTRGRERGGSRSHFSVRQERAHPYAGSHETQWPKHSRDVRRLDSDMTTPPCDDAHLKFRELLLNREFETVRRSPCNPGDNDNEP